MIISNSIADATRSIRSRSDLKMVCYSVLSQRDQTTESPGRWRVLMSTAQTPELFSFCDFGRCDRTSREPSLSKRNMRKALSKNSTISDQRRHHYIHVTHDMRSNTFTIRQIIQDSFQQKAPVSVPLHLGLPMPQEKCLVLIEDFGEFCHSNSPPEYLCVQTAFLLALFA